MERAAHDARRRFPARTPMRGRSEGPYGHATFGQRANACVQEGSGEVAVENRAREKGSRVSDDERRRKRACERAAARRHARCGTQRARASRGRAHHRALAAAPATTEPPREVGLAAQGRERGRPRARQAELRGLPLARRADDCRVMPGEQISERKLGRQAAVEQQRQHPSRTTQ